MLIGMTEKSLIMVAWSWILMDIMSKLRTYSFSSFESHSVWDFATKSLRTLFLCRGLMISQVRVLGKMKKKKLTVY